MQNDRKSARNVSTTEPDVRCSVSRSGCVDGGEASTALADPPPMSPGAQTMDAGDSSVQQAKQAMRSQIKAALSELSDKELHEQSARACDLLLGSELFRMARTLMVFAPIAHEVDVSHLALRAFQENKVVCLPKIDWDHRRMWPVVVNSFDDHSLVADRYGLRTPNCGTPMPIDLVDLVIVPGLAFDTDGRRLGRGGGYYDRFLSLGAFSGRSMALCFDCQIVDTVPAQGHDVRMNMIATDRRIINVESQPHRVDRR